MENGSKLWRFVYSFEGKRKKIAFGAYSNTTLENARRKAEEVREQIAAGIDPAELRKTIKQVKKTEKLNIERIKEGLPVLNGFSDVSRQWLESIAHLINARTHRTKTSRIERLAFPVLGNLSIKEINSVDVMAALKPIIERRQLETAHRLHSEVCAILAYAIAILEAIKPLTSHGQYVFPSRRGNGRPLSDNAIRAALQTLGYDSDVMTAYGVRTTASTLLNEQGWSPDAIERQLAHAPRDHVCAAYNRAHYLDERRRMMQAWAYYLDALKKRAEIIPFR